jgi:CRISPR-associated protein Cas2
MPLLVAYDIPDDRRRAKVALVLGRFGRRIQYSVFLLRRGSADDVARALADVVDGREDNVRIQPICGSCEAKAILIGLAKEAERPAWFRVF